MRGICGVLSVEPRHVEPATRAMMRAMVHRGPDDEGFEQRPLGGADTATADCLIFNGEISNVRSLQTRLHAEGIEVRSSGDTEVLLKALSLWGERALEH